MRVEKCVRSSRLKIKNYTIRCSLSCQILMSEARLLLHGELQLIHLSFQQAEGSMLPEPFFLSLGFQELRQAAVALVEALIDMIRYPEMVQVWKI